jgi:hypothetical protein
LSNLGSNSRKPNAKSYIGRHLEEKYGDLFEDDVPEFSSVAQKCHEESRTNQEIWSQDAQHSISRIRKRNAKNSTLPDK